MTLTPQQLAQQINSAMKADVMKMGNDPSLSLSYVPTGIYPIDLMLDGGMPRNRIVEFYGGYSTLKSYIGLRLIAAAQAHGGVAGLIDTESAYDLQWAGQNGVRADDLLYVSGVVGEAAMDAAELMVRNKVDVLVWDSVAATLPQSEAGKRLMGENIQPARQAALMSAGLRRLVTGNSRTAIMFCNQTRTNLAIKFGPNETTPGGRALPFYASARISMRRSKGEQVESQMYDGKSMVTSKQTVTWLIRATVEKSKIGVPYRDYLFGFDTRTGEIDELSFLLAMGIEHGIIHRTTSSITYGRKAYRSGKAFLQWLSTDKTAQTNLKAEISRKHTGRPAPVSKTGGSPRKKLHVKKG